jgi:hypothetical protein
MRVLTTSSKHNSNVEINKMKCRKIKYNARAKELIHTNLIYKDSLWHHVSSLKNNFRICSFKGNDNLTIQVTKTERIILCSILDFIGT